MRGIYRSALATKLQAFVNQRHGRPQWPSAGHYHSDNKACHISFTIVAQNSGFSSTIDVLLCHEHGWRPAPPSSVAPPVRFINASTNARHSAMFGWNLGSSDADTFCHWKMNGKICTRLKNNEALTVPVRSHYLRHYPTDYGKKSDPATSASSLYVTASLLTARIQETYKHRGAYSAAEDENTGPENADCYARRVTRRPTARPVLFRCSPTISSFVTFSTDRFFSTVRCGYDDCRQLRARQSWASNSASAPVLSLVSHFE